MIDRNPIVYLDTNVFIRTIECSPMESAPLDRPLKSLQGHPGAAVTSDLTWGELLAPTKRVGDLSHVEKRELYENLFFTERFITLLPVSFRILDETSTLRLQHSQKLPDAIHIVTAIMSGCRYFMSFDTDALRTPASLEWVYPDEGGVEKVLSALRE